MNANVDTRLSDRAMKEFAAEAKIGLLATVSPDGMPHLTLITTLQARTPQQLMWGQFIEGRSKDHVRRDRQCELLWRLLRAALLRRLRVWRL